MSIIKGLITKDLLQLKSYRKTLLIFMIIFIFTSFAQSSIDGIGNMLVIMTTLGFGMFSIATFNYDETAKADKYILTLPLTKKEVVLSKYILVIMSTIIGAILGTIISSVVISIVNKQLPDMMELLYLAIGGIFGIGIIESIQIPCIYKYGSEKGRMYLFIVSMVLVWGAIAIGILIKKFNIQIPENNILGLLEKYILIILPVVIAIMFYISYKISYKIYSKKEV